MNQEVYDELVKGRASALLQLEALDSRLKNLLVNVQKPLSRAEASVIIKQIWSDDQTARNNLLVKLSDADTSRNSEVVGYEYLPLRSYNVLLKELPDVVGYVKVAFEYLATLIKDAIDRLKVAGAYDEVAQERYDHFRKQVLRYMDYCGGCNFQMIPDTSDIDSWEGLTLESHQVECGDYLFIDDLEERVEETHKSMLEERLTWGRQDTLSLASLGYASKSWENAVKLPLWFIVYLQNLLTQE